MLSNKSLTQNELAAWGRPSGIKKAPHEAGQLLEHAIYVLGDISTGLQNLCPSRRDAWNRDKPRGANFI